MRTLCKSDKQDLQERFVSKKATEILALMRLEELWGLPKGSGIKIKAQSAGANKPDRSIPYGLQL
jgi:hypothetical protein